MYPGTEFATPSAQKVYNISPSIRLIAILRFSPLFIMCCVLLAVMLFSPSPVSIKVIFIPLFVLLAAFMVKPRQRMLEKFGQ